MGFKQQRKIVKIGKGSSGVILPQDWLEFYGLKKGDEIALLGNALIVIAPKHMERKARHIIDEEERK